MMSLDHLNPGERIHRHCFDVSGRREACQIASRSTLDCFWRFLLTEGKVLIFVRGFLFRFTYRAYGTIRATEYLW